MIIHLIWCGLGFLAGSFLTFVLTHPEADSFKRVGRVELRCTRCGRLWDEHTGMGACPNGRGSYAGPRPWER